MAKEKPKVERPDLIKFGATGRIISFYRNGESCGHIKCENNARLRNPCPDCFRLHCMGTMILRQRKGPVYLERINYVTQKEYMQLTDVNKKKYVMHLYQNSSN